MLVGHHRKDFGGSELVDTGDKGGVGQLVEFVGNDAPGSVVGRHVALHGGVDNHRHDDIAQAFDLPRLHTINQVADNQLAGIEPFRQVQGTDRLLEHIGDRTANHELVEAHQGGFDRGALAVRGLPALVAARFEVEPEVPHRFIQPGAPSGQ